MEDMKEIMLSESAFKKKFVSYLISELCYIYCHNCRGNEKDKVNTDFCEDCHRKYINWELSQATAETIAEKAISFLKEGEYDDADYSIKEVEVL